MASICKFIKPVVSPSEKILIGTTSYSIRNCRAGTPCSNMYDCRKYSPCLPCDSVALPFDCLCGVPSGVFRCTYGECLGPQASKCGCYQNPEFFSFHNMSFFDFHYILQCCRQPQPDSKRKPKII